MRAPDQTAPASSDEPLDRLARLVARVLEAPVAAIALREGAGFRLAAAHGAGPVRGGRAPLAGLLDATEADTGPRAVHDAAAAGGAERTAATAAGVRAWASVPIEWSDGKGAALCIAAPQPRGWTPAELERLAELAVVAADALRRGSERAREAQLRHAQRIEAVVQLAGGIAHDFNNLLTAILGSAELLLEDEALAADARADVEQIKKAATRAAHLTHQLLAFSRRQVLQPRLLDLNALVEDMGRLLRRLLGDGFEVEVELAPALDPVLADLGQLERAIVDLALRARDAMPGGGRLRLATAPVTIDAERARGRPGLGAGRYAALEIRDSGPALERNTLDRIFEPFAAGTGDAGLGLASVHGVVRQSGGYVSAESAPGRGTAFTILLATMEHPPEAPAEPAEGGETILLVEDEEQVRKLAQRVLERAGYRVVPAGDAGTAVALANRHAGPIHLLVVDMFLPGLSGRELAAQLSIHRPAIKVLYISGTTDDAIARHLVLAPGTEFLQKPFPLAQLLQKVRKVLDAPLARS
ncbi:MAG TPA: response regulator [Gemmatimonadales bacterium]|nr:response regulator [Gemmatimonadales bacterium]